MKIDLDEIDLIRLALDTPEENRNYIQHTADAKKILNRIEKEIKQVKNTVDLADVSSELNICEAPKFKDWLSDNFKKRSEFYYDEIVTDKTYSIQEIQSKYVMKFRTNI